MLFLTMELIDGVPLSARRAGGSLSLSETLRVGSEIARGLAAAHAADVVHRDLKPENVMVSDDRVVITDFGIARSARIEGDAHATTGLVGTPAYMAPEQVSGQPLDGRTHSAITPRLRLQRRPPDTVDRLDPAVRELAEAALKKLSTAAADPRELEGAIELLEQAVAQAPDDAGVQGALAFGLARRRIAAFSAGTGDEWSRAEELCYQAIASDPTNPLALQALGMLRYVGGDMRGAARALREALARSPDLVESNAYLGRLLDESGHTALARERIALLERLAPGRPEPFFLRFREAGFSGDLAALDRAAEEYARRTSNRLFSFAMRSRFEMWWNDRERMRETLSALQPLEWEFAKNSLVPLLRIALGDEPGDAATVERLFAHDLAEGVGRRRQSFGHQLITEGMLALGASAEALAHVEAAAELPLIDVVWLDRCPLLAPLRGEPRFAKARAVVTARIEDMWS